MSGSKGKKLVIVESPKKAVKIQGFLGPGYIVKASMGHIRDLPRNASEVPAAIKKEEWGTMAVNVDDDFTPIYIVPSEKKKTVKELKDALKQSDELIIATDEDREGESIGWHLLELLQPKVPVSRMTFAEITKTAIQAALNNRRDLDQDLIAAQEARRVLDRLYGYTLSPLMWAKISGGKSAGRVQSVAVRILVQRELERLAFRSGTYWDLNAELASQQEKKKPFSSTLISVDGKRIATGKDFDESTGKIKEGLDVLLLEEKQAKELQNRLRTVDWIVKEVKERTETRTPYAPFITSTLQRDASSRLGMSPKRTMQVAQALYEGGFITYMRTDSVTLSKEAMDAARRSVETRYGKDYLSPSPRTYKNKSKNAQEAHEAIRPAGTAMKTAQELGLSGEQARLYDLIWKRTVASQMANATLRFKSVTITAAETEFRATGRTTDFAGFFRAYVEGKDDPDEALDDRDNPLPNLKEGDKLDCHVIDANSHDTKPPARYNEASLVKALEDAGIGRPSTYSSIIDTIQSRGYARKQGHQLIPTFAALGVTRLLESHFPHLVDIEFTAKMEQTLDDISNGQADRTSYLHEFYSGERGIEQQVERGKEEIDRKDANTMQLDGITANICLGRYGSFVEREEEGQRLTASIPEDIAPADLTDEMVDDLIRKKQEGPKTLGMHPEENAPVYLMDGPYGPYLQLGDADADGEKKPKRAGLPKSHPPEVIDLDIAVELLSLPRRIGRHPETEKVVNAGIGRYGPYVLHDKKYASFDKQTHTTVSPSGEKQDVLSVSLDTAVEMLKKVANRGSSALKELGEHPDSGTKISIHDGRYGHYVKCGRINATIPKETNYEELTLEKAVQLINERAEKTGKKVKKKKKTAKKKATKKKATKKKTAAKKTTKKKKAVKKTES